MRTIVIFFMLIFVAGVGVHGCTGLVGGSGVSERVIAAEPQAIVEAMNRTLLADGMEQLSRSDTGDYYRLALTEAEMRAHPKFSRLAEEGALTFHARVTRRRIEFTGTFASGLVSGFTIDMAPAPDGNGTLATVSPLIRPPRAGKQDDRLTEALSRNFRRYGEQVLQTIADAAEG